MQIAYINKMVGILKNRCQIILLCLVVCSFVSCKKKNENPSKFIENNFLAIVDTVAYGYGAFILPPPLPNDTILKTPFYSSLAVELNDSVRYNRRIDQYVLSFFNSDKNLKSAFKDLLDNGEYYEFSLDTNFPKQMGKYHLFFGKEKTDTKIKYAGRIDIENLKIYKDRAMLILSESVDKHGKTYVILFVKEKNNWKIIKKELLYMT